MSDPLAANPCFGRIRDAERRSGLKRGMLYKLAARNPGLFKKAGAATVVDLEMLDSVLAALPPADVSERAIGNDAANGLRDSA
jgi:hypothetical protein